MIPPTPKDQAQDRLVHGLLRLRSEQASGAAAARLQQSLERLRREVHAPALPPVSAGPGSATPPRLRRAILVGLAVAAHVVVIAGLFTLRGPSAFALVRSAVEAEMGSRESRHRIEAFGADPEGTESLLLTGSLDQAPPKLAALVLAAPDGGLRLRMGRTSRGVWTQLGEGAPSWSSAGAPMTEVLGHPAAMLSSLDDFLDMLTRSYELEVVARPQGSPEQLVRATRRKPHEVQPDAIELWIDRSSGRAERIELLWSPGRSLGFAEWHRLLILGPDPATLLLLAPRLAGGAQRSLVRLSITSEEPRTKRPADFEPR